MMQPFTATTTDFQGFPSAQPPTTAAAGGYLNKATYQQRLLTLIEGARETWTYGIFWQSSVNAASGVLLLHWGDGYYNGSEEDEEKKKATSPADTEEQQHRKRVLRELNSLISDGDGDSLPDEELEEVTDTEWFFLVSMTQTFDGAGLLGLALFAKVPTWIAGADRLAMVHWERCRQARMFGLQTMVIVPVGGGVVELGSTDLIYQSSELMSKIRVLFSFNSLKISSGYRVPQPAATPAVADQWETDPSVLWLADPSMVETKDSVSPVSATAEISVTKPPIQFANPGPGAITKCPSSIQIQQRHNQQKHQNQNSNSNFQTQSFSTKGFNFYEFVMDGSAPPPSLKPETGEILNFGNNRWNSSPGSVFFSRYEAATDDEKNKRPTGATSRGSTDDGMLSFSSALGRPSCAGQVKSSGGIIGGGDSYHSDLEASVREVESVPVVEPEKRPRKRGRKPADGRVEPLSHV